MMPSENVPSDHSASVARIFRGEEFEGTGFLVSPDCVLTCFHVVDRHRDKPLGVRLSDGTIRNGALEAISETEVHDLALIRISGLQARNPVCFLIGLKTHHEKALCKLSWQAIGYDSRDSETFLSGASVCREPAFQWDSKTGTLLDVQVNLGLPSGFSGAPVLVEIPGEILCIGIATQGGIDSAKSRIRLADCVVGFLQESRLEVRSQDASIALPKAPALSRWRVNSPAGEKQNHTRMWVAAIGLLAAVVIAFAGLYVFPKFAHDENRVVQNTQTANQPVVPPPPFYRARIMMYSSATPPKFYVNKKLATVDGYDGRTATFRLHPGTYQVEADYLDRICTAVISVTRDMGTEAECHLK